MHPLLVQLETIQHQIWLVTRQKIRQKAISNNQFSNETRNHVKLLIADEYRIKNDYFTATIIEMKAEFKAVLEQYYLAMQQQQHVPAYDTFSLDI